MLTKPRTLSQTELRLIFDALISAADFQLAAAEVQLKHHSTAQAYLDSANANIALARRFTTSRSK